MGAPRPAPRAPRPAPRAPRPAPRAPRPASRAYVVRASTISATAWAASSLSRESIGVSRW
jgi:hypothetical protein